MDTALLLTWGATAQKVVKGQLIFLEGEMPGFFFMVEKGVVKMINTSDDGKEFTQGIFYVGDTFGEPPLLINRPYPATAVACCDSVLLRISKERFDQILINHKEFGAQLLQIFANRIYRKSELSKSLVQDNPEKRILKFMEYWRKSCEAEELDEPLPFTRQELANMLGLRVETVIRKVKDLERRNELKLHEHRIYLKPEKKP